MALSIKKCVYFSALVLVLGALSVPAQAQTGGQATAGNNTGCAAAFQNASRIIVTNIDEAARLLNQASGSCTSGADIQPSDAASIAASIRAIMPQAMAAAAAGESTTAAGQVMSKALAVAGQPSIVAVDPGLYGEVLIASVDFAQEPSNLGGNGDASNPSAVADASLSQEVQFARITGSIPSMNQQPTTMIEQK